MLIWSCSIPVLRRILGAHSALVRDSPLVPAVRSSFVGRVDELATLTRLIGRERLVSLVGPGGSGKTRLAGEVARGGACELHGFVELAPVRPGTALAPVVLNGCGIRDEPGRGALDRLHDRFGRAGAVLVLDNCEQVRDEVASLVADLLRGCPELRVLVTSRVALGLTGETVLPLSGLDRDADAVALFVERARRVQPALPSGPETEAAARRICLLADGLPLAIELAAAHARALALPDVEAGMVRRLRFLATRDSGALPHHRSLLASIAWSAELVGQDGRDVLAALSVVEGRSPSGPRWPPPARAGRPRWRPWWTTAWFSSTRGKPATCCSTPSATTRRPSSGTRPPGRPRAPACCGGWRHWPGRPAPASDGPMRRT
jgi:hypothetical protein